MKRPSWILVAGTGKEPLPPELEDTAVRLGRALAEQGLCLVTCGWPGIDRAVGAAFAARLRERGEDPTSRFKQYRALGRPPSVPEGRVEIVSIDADEYLHAVDAASVAIVLGGLGGTWLIHQHARNVGIPVVPLPSTEGDARRVFDAVRRSFDGARHLGISREDVEALDRPPAEAVAVAVRLTVQHLEARAVRDGHYLTPDHVVGQENEEAFDRLVTELREANVLGFVGAGTSISGGYPDWIALIERMRKALPNQVSQAMAFVSREEDLLMRAEHYRQLMGPDAFASFIREQFGDEAGRCQSLHEDLVRLPFSHVLTTNYDRLLERAHARVFPGELPHQVSWRNPTDIEDFLRAARRRGQQRRYVHLHGTYNDPESIVLTESDYQQRYHHTAAGEALLSVLFTAHAFLFVGFSFSDMDMMGVFRGTMARLRLGSPLHFAFMALDPSRQDPTLVRQRLRKKYKIEPVFYLATPEHAGLHELVRRLHERTSAGS